MHRHMPTSDSDKLSLLASIGREAQQPDRKHEIFDAAMIQTVLTTAAVYQREYESLNLARNHIKSIRDALKNEVRYLKQLVRRGFAVVRARAKDPYFENAHPAFYSLLEITNHPTLLRDLCDPVQVAKDLLADNAKLAAAGVRVLIDPSPEQIENVLQNVTAYSRQLSDGLERERLALAAIRHRRQQVGLLFRRVTFEIEQATHDWQAAARRNLMRAFGFRFKSKTGEVVAEKAAETRVQQTPGTQPEQPAQQAAAQSEQQIATKVVTPQPLAHEKFDSQLDAQVNLAEPRRRRRERTPGYSRRKQRSRLAECGRARQLAAAKTTHRLLRNRRVRAKTIAPRCG